MTYSRSLQWIGHSFKGAKVDLVYQNADRGRILASVHVKHDCLLGNQHYIYYSLTIDIKNERARIHLEANSMGDGTEEMELRNNYFCPGSLYNEMKKDFEFLQKEYFDFINNSKEANSDW